MSGIADQNASAVDVIGDVRCRVFRQFVVAHVDLVGRVIGRQTVSEVI